MPACEAAVEDIEDIISRNDATLNDRIAVRRDVLPKARRMKLNSRNNGEVQEQEFKPVGDSIIPGTQSIFVRTWGCSHNNSDSEYMAGQLAAYGYRITGNLTKVQCFQDCEIY